MVKMRNFGAKVSGDLHTTLNGGEEEVAAVMLTIALDVAHKSVMTVMIPSLLSQFWLIHSVY